MLCHVMWNLSTVGSLQFCNDSAIASLMKLIKTDRVTNNKSKSVFENNEVQIGDAMFETLNLRSKYEG